MGRPSLPAVRRRTHTIGVRLSASEWQTIAALAQGRGLRPTAYVREAALSDAAQPTSPAASAAVEERRELRRIGSNLNQIARRVNSRRRVAGADVLQALADLQQWIAARVQ